MEQAQSEQELEYVGFWSRMLASMVDTVLLTLVIIPVMLALYGSAYWEDERLFKGYGGVLFEWILPIIAVLIFWQVKQSTPGKMLIGAKIVDATTGENPQPAQLIVRYVGYYVSLLGFGLGFIWIAFDKRKQGWHDKMAGTVVVRRKDRGKQQGVSFRRN